MAAGGVDSSNAPEGPLLLPEDPDACARGLRAALSAALDVDLGVLLTDTSSRIWRVGVGDIVLGDAGVAVLQYVYGGTRADGRPRTVNARHHAGKELRADVLVTGQ